MLDSITNTNTQHLAITELFSCLFIQKNEKYVCRQDLAQKVVNLLEVYDRSVEIKGAHAMFQARKAGKKDALNLDGYFVKNPQLYKLVDDEKWDQASQLTLYLPDYREFYARALPAALRRSSEMSIAGQTRDGVLFMPSSSS
jgi:hypothetical protein